MNNLIILGNFDGVHLAHQNLIKKAVQYAKTNNMKSIVYTFKTLSKNKEQLTSIKEREKKLKKLGVDEILFDEFDRVKKYTPLEFVEKVLKYELNAKIVFCGYNYTFGYLKEGNSKMLQKLINAVVIPEYRDDDKLVSSTKIRELLYLGEIRKANRLLGHNFKYEGIVVKGKQLGRLIGFPTANIHLCENKVKIKNGVYGSYIKIEGYENKFLSITNIGTNPTIADNNNISIETYIFDFNDDIYDKKIEVSIIKMIRKEKKFSTIDKLKNQIKKDVDMWRLENA